MTPLRTDARSTRSTRRTETVERHLPDEITRWPEHQHSESLGRHRLKYDKSGSRPNGPAQRLFHPFARSRVRTSLATDLGLDVDSAGTVDENRNRAPSTFRSASNTRKHGRRSNPIQPGSIVRRTGQCQDGRTIRSASTPHFKTTTPMKTPNTIRSTRTNRRPRPILLENRPTGTSRLRSSLKSEANHQHM